ncbi:type II toxin-antitoxin system prevent-host-death family antitoxin [Psychrobacter proteolyticus]|uniref:type II toxin-antitoxin system Phd/YefM family antitoxin n=1 Tax=Psychrobacter proteolyticus TaxID=147825 RepID=UPI00311F684B
MKRISFSKTNKDFEAVLDTVNYNDDPIIIGRHNDNDAVVMSLAHYNALMETVYLLKSPANAAQLAKSITQYRADKVVTRELIDMAEGSDKSDGRSDDNEHTNDDIENI